MKKLELMQSGAESKRVLRNVAVGAVATAWAVLIMAF